MYVLIGCYIVLKRSTLTSCLSLRKVENLLQNFTCKLTFQMFPRQFAKYCDGGMLYVEDGKRTSSRKSASPAFPILDTLDAERSQETRVALNVVYHHQNPTIYFCNEFRSLFSLSV